MCTNCPAIVSDSFLETRYSSEGDEIGTKEVIKTWCDAPYCIRK